MIRRSDGPKSYWGYYQDYLVQISGKKIQKILTSIFGQKSKIPNGKKNWPKRRLEAMLKFWPKIECTRPVWYVEANMARSCRLACLKIEGNDLLK